MVLVIAGLFSVVDLILMFDVLKQSIKIGVSTTGYIYIYITTVQN